MPATANPLRIAALLPCLLMASIATATAPPDYSLQRRLDGVLEAWVPEERIVGAVVLVAQDGEVLYRRAAGNADRERGIPASESTIFRLASMTKTIVSATALALVERGVLSLDDTVDRWLPNFRPRLPDGRRPPITIRQLMTHTSGLSYGFFEDEQSPYRVHGVSNGLDQPGLSIEENLRRLALAPLKFEPGSAWQYSLSTDVLGAVIERAAEVPLPEAVARYVTGPLGMSDTAFEPADALRLAKPYRDGDPRAVLMSDEPDRIPLGPGAAFSPRRAFDSSSYPSGGAGMSGTAGDYLKFLEAIRRGGAPILNPESAALLTEHATGSLRAESEGPGWGFSLGAGVLLDPEAAGTPQNAGTWQWGGVLGGHWFVDPVAKLTVVVLTNTAVAGVIGDFPAAIRDAVYASYNRTGSRSRAPTVPPGRQSNDGSQAIPALALRSRR